MLKRPVLITGAMELELEDIISRLKNKIHKEENSYILYEGKIDNYPVLILRTKVGVINAAIAVSMIIQKYNPIAIINQGTAGSHEYNCHKFDLVVGDTVININTMKTGVKKLGRGTNPLEWQIKEFHTESETETIVYNCDEKMLEIAKSMKEKYKFGKMHIGRIGSGDIWNREIDRINWFNKNFKTLCEEMEAVSIYKVANIFEIPVIGFKVVSNNELIGEKFDAKTAEACQEFTYEFVREYLKHI